MSPSTARIAASPRRRTTRGMGLLDALIALTILSFGLLGMTRLQTSLLRQSTESQSRLTAVQFGDELLSIALIDNANAPCYTLPVDVACASATAKARTLDWETRVKAALPGTVTATSALAAGQLTLTLSWTGKSTDEARTLQVTTDVRPN
jgi:type IV pilus assembly protein PilV